jgi:BolA protein
VSRDSVTAERLRDALERALPDAQVQVRDDSAQHAGHAGAREGRHFSISVSSPAFDGLSRVARHRLVYDAARPLIAEGIHALAIEQACTPAEAKPR